MKREFKIHVYLDVSKDFKYKSFNRFANIVFECTKDTVNCIFSDTCIHEIFGWGKHSDAIKVYTALKNNGYMISYCEGV